jgi:hypothetical protein
VQRQAWMALDGASWPSGCSAAPHLPAPLLGPAAWRLARSSGSRSFPSTSRHGASVPSAHEHLVRSARAASARRKNHRILASRARACPGSRGRASRWSCSAPWGLTTESDVGTAAVCAKPRRFLRLAGTRSRRPLPAMLHLAAPKASGDSSAEGRSTAPESMFGRGTEAPPGAAER